MSEDDIDIEEHDVFDNPNLRRIFPDLSIIKKELIQYEEDLNASQEDALTEAAFESSIKTEQIDPHSAGQVLQDASLKSQTSNKPPNNKLEVHLRFKNFLDSLADDNFEDSDDNSDTLSIPSNFSEVDNPSSPHNLSEPENETVLSIAETDKTCKYVKLLQKNISILGSKPNVDPKNKCTKKKQPKLVLKNISFYLNACGRYCHDCRILFPNVAAFHYHTCLTVSNSNVKKKEQSISKTSGVKFQCHICYTEVSSKGNLQRHIKNIHNKGKDVSAINSDNIISESRVLRNHEKETSASPKTTIKTPNCFHCKETFKTRVALIEHLYALITPNKKASKTSKKKDNHSKVQDDMVDKDNEDGNKSRKIECNKRPASIYHTQTHKRSNNKTVEIAEKVPMETEESNIAENANNKQNANKIKDKDLLSGYDNQMDHESSNNSESENKQDRGMDDSQNVVTVPNKEAYQCFVCSLYIVDMKSYAHHMLGHNIKEISDAGKVLFGSQCKFCAVKLSTIKTYNKHIVKNHSEKYNKKLKRQDKGFKSVLFKCVKCNVFFLSAKAAMNHSDHENIFVNKKCQDCQRSFKINDMALHLKQHSLSTVITAYVLCESALSRVLFKCLKCAVHFSEKEYFMHYAMCDLELPNSAYCKTCDILIYTADLAMHKKSHKGKNLQSLDFTFIESDIIQKIKQIDKNSNIDAKSKFALTFCNICNCFIGDVGRKRNAHVEGRCGIIQPRMCRQCGLIFTSRGYVSHKNLHDKVEKLQLQTFYFYDIKSKKQMNPPIPEYPKCNICEVHFLNKPAIRGHVCSKQTYKLCQYCNIKLTDGAYKLHINFHNYKLKSSALNKKQRISLKFKEPITTSTCSTSTSVKSVEQESILVTIAENTIKPNFRFNCIICDIIFHMYDEVVQHCHDHYDIEIRKNDQHKIKSNNKETWSKEIKFDPFYIRYGNKVWHQHIFANLSVEQIQSILDDSIYKYECRLKLEQIQTGPEKLALYKCDTCRSYIDPDDLYSHATNKCLVSKKYPCSSCGLCFYSESYRTVHEKIHDIYEINISSYKILLLNKKEDRYFTEIMDALNKFILYQCRNCEAVVDKLQRETHKCCKDDLTRCSHCKLLYHKIEFSSHVAKHNDITDFKPEHMVVIMFGKSGFQKYGTLKSTFAGIIHDLTFYKCTSCGLCVTSKDQIRKHCCIARGSQAQCPKCYLCFKTTELQEHLNIHDNNSELVYDDFNSNIITFNVSTAKVKPNNAKEITIETSKEKDSVAESANSRVNKDLATVQTLYKCNCGLHFLEEINAKTHSESCMPKMKLSRQNCFKCNLLFTPGELFNHLLNHHGDKNVQYKYDIKTVSSP